MKVLLIGYHDEDGIDAVTGAKTPGIQQLQAAFDKANPDITMEIISIPWGEGATGYAPKTEAMIKANEACLYEMPAGPAIGPRADCDLDGDVDRRSREAMRSAPIITYVNANHLILATDTELVSVSAADPRNVFWRVPLPDSPRITRPSPTDRQIATASISYHQGRVHVREHATLWTFG
ncbi:hypothetical protein IMZ11_17905 [Microtetraspora sp. AC03309]|uniref:hypothetical protein n=1 Tax=Microtetraspora sp. AC03309 TaxID=2779376 RepID=UPI001E39C651|nr:hypothetical protein [Microtetraspora sp. AC03309]MCC5577502.1 hypothetical protein [Microtetraspora sp. AC03309]